MNTIKECFYIILNGQKEDSRLATKQITKILYSATAIESRAKQKHKDIDEVLKNPANKYAEIKEEWRQENFVRGISVIYFLRDEEVEIDYLFPWLFQLLQHSNGNIRQSAVRIICHELAPLTVYIRIPNYTDTYSHKKIAPEKCDQILFSLYTNLQKLAEIFYHSRYEKYKYIESLPVGPYKSIELILAEMEDLVGRKYMDHMRLQHQIISNKNIGVA